MNGAWDEREVAMAILLFHMWNYNVTLKFRAKIKE